MVSRYGLSNRQSKALLMFLERGKLRLDDLVGAFPDVNKRTLQRDLKALVDKGILRQSGAARAAHYLLNIKKLR
jgi:DNA-binding HxlR family transcriptional regulator